MLKQLRKLGQQAGRALLGAVAPEHIARPEVLDCDWEWLGGQLWPDAGHKTAGEVYMDLSAEQRAAFAEGFADVVGPVVAANQAARPKTYRMPPALLKAIEAQRERWAADEGAKPTAQAALIRLAWAGLKTVEK